MRGWLAVSSDSGNVNTSKKSANHHFFFSTLNSCKVELKGPSQPIQGSIVMSARQLFAIIAAIAVVALLDETFFLID